jgi:glycosyltransferase 2 family protein
VDNAPDAALRSPATESPQQPRGHPYGAFVLRAGAGVAVVTFLLWHYDAKPIFHLLARERLGFFAATIVLYVAGQLMSAFRWQLLAQLGGFPGRYGEYFAYYFAGMFTNLFVPGLIGGDALRTLYLGRRYGRLGDAIASVAADRGVGLIALFWFAGACALFLNDQVGLPSSVIRPTLIAGGVAVAVWLAAPLLARFASLIRGRLERFVSPVMPYLSRPLALLPAIALSVLLQASLALCQYLLALGLGLDISLSAFMLCVPIANVVASLPITLNGLGVRETAYLFLFGMVGVGKPDAIALGLLWFASTMLGGLTGAIPFVATRMPLTAQVPES